MTQQTQTFHHGVRPMRFAAYSRSLALTAHLAASADWQVYSTHDHVCNLRNQDTLPIALIAPGYGNGPFHLVVPRTFFQNLEPGMPALVSPELIALPGVKIDLRPAQPWQPRVAFAPSGISDDAFSWLCEAIAPLTSPLLCPATATPSALQRIATDGIQSLQHGLQNHAPIDIATGVQRLAGLGPGLTPAGDDYLLGWLFGLYCVQTRLAQHNLYFANIAAIVIEFALPRTTWLSGAWLRHASKGEFGEPWHELAASLSTNPAATRRAIHLIRQSGATSGEDALVGLLHAWTSVASLRRL